MLATPSILTVQGALRQVAETIKDKMNTVMVLPGDVCPLHVPFAGGMFADLVTNGSVYLPKSQPISEELLTTSHREIALFRRQGDKVYWYSRNRKKEEFGVIPYEPRGQIRFDLDELYFSSAEPKYERAREVALDIAQRDTVVRVLTPGSAERQTQGHTSTLQQQATVPSTA